MQTSPFEAGYPTLPTQGHAAMYGTMPGFDPAGLKFHHSHHGMYADATQETAAFYNYGMTCPTQDYVREPPSYADSTTTSSALLHHGFVTGDYYKSGGLGMGVNRQTDLMADYGGVRTPTQPVHDNFLMKHEGTTTTGSVVSAAGGVCGADAINSGAGGHVMDFGTRYSSDDLQQLQQQHHHQHHPHPHPHPHQQQQQPHLHAHRQPHNHQLGGTGDLTADEGKMECEDFKPSASDLANHPSNHRAMPALHHPHRPQLPHPHQRHDDLSQQGEGEAHHHPQSQPHPQSPASEDGSREGAETSTSHTDAEGSTSVRGEDESQQQSDNNTTTTASTATTTNTNNTGDEKSTSNDVKPTLSYIALIAKSILESPHRRLNLGSIYGWIEKNFPYYKNRGQGWRNSVRHNLSLNDCFIKAGRCEDGKGNYWAIHPANMQDFLRGDFRQRRRSRRRGRKKDCELSVYHATHPLNNSYLNAAADVAAARAQMTFPPSLPSLYASPYNEAERRAYRLDEALLRQSMNNPLFKWYHQNQVYPPSSSPSAAAAAAAVNSYGGVGGVGGSTGGQWGQTGGYGTESNGQAVYSPLNSNFSRSYSTPGLV